MKTSHFDVSALPPARIFYERELGRLSRPSRGWARGDCPFHESKSHLSFSVNLESGGFYCFGCEAKGGDVVGFMQLRYRLTFKQAARELGAWREEISLSELQKMRRAKADREREQAAHVAKKDRERQERISARDHLHVVERLYDEAIREHEWIGMSELLPRVREAEQRYCQLAGLEVCHGR